MVSDAAPRSSAGPAGAAAGRVFSGISRTCTAAARAATFSTANLAFSYRGSLRHYTTEPIQRIRESQNDAARLRELLVQFRAGKGEELEFINKAAAIAAAAVIGVFSWPDISSSFWLCPLLWRCSFWLSVFALISSAQHRLLEQLPKSKADAAELGAEEVKNATLLILREKQSPEDRLESGLWAEEARSLCWLWQTPMMLMSLSWLTFLVGFQAYIVGPLFTHGLWTTEKSMAVAVLCVGAIAFANFVGCGMLARATVEQFKDRQWLARPQRGNSV